MPQAYKNTFVSINALIACQPSSYVYVPTPLQDFGEHKMTESDLYNCLSTYQDAGARSTFANWINPYPRTHILSIMMHIYDAVSHSG